MSEPTQHTNVDGDVNGHALSGSFSGPVQTGQNVVVNVQGIPEPPDTIKQQIKELWVMFSLDRFERQDRQKEADQRYVEAKDDRGATRRLVLITLILVFISLAIGLLNSVFIVQLVSRFEWLWQ